MYLSCTTTVCKREISADHSCAAGLWRGRSTPCSIQAVYGSVYLGMTYEITLACSSVIAVWGDRSPRRSSVWARGCGSVSL